MIVQLDEGSHIAVRPSTMGEPSREAIENEYSIKKMEWYQQKRGG